MEKVIPPGLNYADIKPEAIENQIRIVKFTPISTIVSAQANDIVRFHLQGNGFYDPYSAYIRIRIQINDLPAVTNADPFAGKFLDRSAHSLFSRLVIRSQGTELERIEQYDVMAAMINDMIYSQEQRLLHQYEGFACKSVSTHGISHQVAAQLGANDYHSIPQFLPMLMQHSLPNSNTHFGDVGVWRARYRDVGANVIVADCTTIGNMAALPYFTGAQDLYTPLGVVDNGLPIGIENYYNITSAASGNVAHGQMTRVIVADNDMYGTTNTGGAAADTIASPTEIEFCIPIYSGIIGVLMPDKKLLPMSLLPLEIEFTMNPHAFYPVGTNVTNRRYTVKKFEIWSHTLFFEQELHRSLEAVVAETGIFIHYNSFYLTPINSYNAAAGALPQYHQLGIYLKSINSVHWVFCYTNYDVDNGPRKLHFVCHNIGQLQLRNGMELTPSEPIIGKTGGSSMSNVEGTYTAHTPFLIETYKAWNKMHDPLSDGAINQFNYNIDQPLAKPDEILEWFAQSHVVGRCQYAITLEGEELGQNKQIITGKKSVIPFDINIGSSYKRSATQSVMFCFLKADFIIYVRPDLVVTRLGL